MNPTDQLARLALQHIDHLPPAEKSKMLLAAAPLIEDEHLSQVCRTTAALLNETDKHQLHLFKLLKS